jgi:hypothetical protein
MGVGLVVIGKNAAHSSLVLLTISTKGMTLEQIQESSDLTQVQMVDTLREISKPFVKL